jgi:hypothetical protein|uniref:calycin-like domain-containing protein n=1 Tax=Candidatus Limisoma sp. TaxID=3076476 RepID=UPI0040259CB9
MKKFYALLLMVFAVAMGVSAQTYYNGKLDVEMLSEKIADGMDARVSLSESADGTYVFKLPDFRITINEEELPCGDIVVEGVTRKDGKLSGSVNDLSLAGGVIHAKVDLVGTETAEGAMDLAITVGWYTDYPEDLEATMPINVTFKGQKYDSVVTEYPGKLDVEMLSEMLVSGQDAKVYLQTIDDGVYMFKLPDFRITINDEELPCGDIVVEGVTRTANAAGFDIAGSVNDLSLAGGVIHAKVDLAGTETAEGAMDLTITVGWYTDYPEDLEATMPINVTFKGQRDAGVNVVEASGAAVRGAEGAIAVDGFAGRVNVYTVDGRLAASAQVDGEATISVAAGLYVVRAGEKAVKVVVK